MNTEVKEAEVKATEFDKRCHWLFESKDGGEDYLARKTGVQCGNCGHELLAYYCESRLYMIKCDYCEIKALVKAESPSEAAYRTFGIAIYPVDEMCEDCAVFFSHVPID